MGRESDIFGLAGGRLHIPVGATLATLMEPIAGQISWVVKYLSGGTLEILGATLPTAGSTLSAGDLSTLSGTGYLMGTSEALSIDGPARFYLSSTSATTVITVLRGKTSGQ